MKLELSIALTENERTRAILEGEISPLGVALVPSPLAPAEIFWRQLKYAEFDISEMSLASLTIASTRGPSDWVALPVFTTRVFFHTDIIVRRDADIDRPADLRGKRVGVPEYQQTRAVWVRGALQHEFGVDARDIEWFMERPVEQSHGGATGFVPPPGIRLTYVRRETDLGGMLVAGELDAVVHHFNERNLVDRALVNLHERPDVRYLFSDRTAESRRYYAATSIYPVNHCVVIRRSLVERHPWLPLNVYTAFVKAKERDEARRLRSLAPYVATGTVSASMFAVDPMPYGCRRNAAVIDTLMTYLAEQGLTDRRMSGEAMFHESTWTL
jgi:4,5-dihydroxyphthalate decarboxylase